MRERQGVQLRDPEPPLTKDLLQSKSLNRLRKSLDNAKNMRLDLFRMRKSVSNTSLDCHLQRSIKSNPTSAVLPVGQIPLNRSVGNSQLTNRLQQITRKLTNAKQEILGQIPSARTLRKSSKQVEQAQSYETKQSLLQTERTKQRSRLALYTSATIKPANMIAFSRNPYCVRGSRYYLGQAVRAMHQKNSLVMEHICQSMQMLLQYRLFKINQQNLAEQERIILPISQECKGKKTLVLDMDETLLHCFQRLQGEADIRLTVSIDGQEFEIGMNLRPYAISFIKKMRKTWEIVIFTASQQQYADAILDQIDPDGVLFHHRLYRQHCRQLTPQLFIKDLSRLNRDPSKIVLVDNSAYSYSMQLDNGIPILPFHEGKDYELAALQSYLHRLQSCQDVREMNKQYFKLERYTNFDNSFDLVKSLYCLTPWE